MSKHTCGPWSVKEGHEHSEDCPLNVWSDDGRIVAAVVGMGGYLLDPPTQEGEANARLIAAAPTMLAALKAAELSLSWHIESQGRGVAMDAENLRKIRAAIAKAES